MYKSVIFLVFSLSIFLFVLIKITLKSEETMERNLNLSTIKDIEFTEHSITEEPLTNATAVCDPFNIGNGRCQERLNIKL